MGAALDAELKSNKKHINDNIMDVSPQNENIDSLFSNTTFYIDFYQRQYKWTDVPVRRLLDDVFYKFWEEQKRFSDSDEESEKIIQKYSWYYLNTYVTNINKNSNKTYIVDGQQRLTTLSLILIKLMHLAEKYNEDELKQWISTKIVGWSGKKKTFWMNHEGHQATLDALYTGKDEIPTGSGVTAKNMATNYKVISDRLDAELTDDHIYDRFVYYFMFRLIIIKLNVEQTNVPMVFEVINDRGVRLKPYEILKGKLLGQIDKEELENQKINELWDGQVEKINKLKEEGIQDFFTYYLRSKFANSASNKKFDREYHRSIFSDTTLNLEHNALNVKKFLKEDFVYYSNLFCKILKYSNEFEKKFEYVYYCRLTDMGQLYMLIMSACTVNDPQEDQKIVSVAYNLDKIFCLLQLQRAHESNSFNQMLFSINEKIRNRDVSVIAGIFDDALLNALKDRYSNNAITSIYNYGYFKETGIDRGKRFIRYFFARIEGFISANTNMAMRHYLYDLVVNTGSTNGFHIEHILAENDVNKALFDNDLDKFQSERNRLGGLLLLKGKDNISSNNEDYAGKLKSYANTLYWNETLRHDSYKSHLDFTNWIAKSGLNFRPMDTFGPDELEERQKLLFEIVKQIWN